MKLTIQDGRDSFYTFDSNRILLLTATDEEQIKQVEFSTEEAGGTETWTKDVLEQEDGVKYVQVPNEFLNGDYTRLVCYAVALDSKGEFTRQKEVFRIKYRPQPEDWFLTYSERITFASIKALTEQYKSNASDSAELASKYAENNEDVAVEPGKYSAKHWSIKSNKKYEEIRSYVGSASDPESALGSIESARAKAVSDVEKQETDSIEAVGTYTSNTAIPSVSQYVEDTAKPALKTYGEQQVDSYVNGTVKPELDRYVNNEKKQVLDQYTEEKKGELDSYTNTDKKKVLDDYVNNVKKVELNTYTNDKKSELDVYKTTKADELNEHTVSLKGSLDGYTTAKEQDILEFTEQKKQEVQGVYQTDLNELKGDLVNNKYVVKDLPENTNLDNLEDVGIFVWGANEGILNAPEGFNTGFILNAKTSIYKKYQIAIEPISRKMYIRTGNPDWFGWKKAVYSDELETYITDYFKRYKIAVKYTNGDSVDSSTEKFDVYVPKNGKYIHYVVVHTVNDDDRSDIWRVAYCYIASLDFTDEKQVTTTGEWEMAIMLNGKDDFIGGYMHGDEKQYFVKFFANGVEWDKTVFSDMRYVDSFSFVQQSDMYDPAPPYLTYKVAEHYSLHDFNLTNEHQLEISQRVKWKMNLGFTTSYMAMFPIAKDVSTKYFNDADYRLKTTPTYIKESDVREVRLNDQNKNVSAVFGISEYPEYDTGNKFLISDNGGTAYNKCYYIIGESGTTDTNNVWKSKTYYDIMFN